MFTSGFAEKAVREEPASHTPIRSKPALQKAETEWNTAYHTAFPPPTTREKGR